MRRNVAKKPTVILALFTNIFGDILYWKIPRFQSYFRLCTSLAGRSGTQLKDRLLVSRNSIVAPRLIAFSVFVIARTRAEKDFLHKIEF